MARVVPVFIASPSDVQPERDHCRRAVDQLSPRLLRLFGIGLSVVDWRDFAPDADSDSKEVFQYRILQNIEPDSLFVGVVHQRLGTPIGRNTPITGTEAEYDYAIRNRQRIRVMTYLKKLESIAEDQLEVARLRKKIKDADLPRQEYSSDTEFGDRILPDLLEAIVRGILGDQGRRRRLYSEFFRFGSRRVGSQISPPLIVYPSIHKHDAGSGASTGNYDWRRRLLPNVVYEDFKAIQKIEAALRDVGVLDYRTVTTLYPQTREPGNRVWLCMPRNQPAQEELANLKARAKFSFYKASAAQTAQTERFVQWKGRKIRSPLATYLAQQRPRKRRPWEGKLGRIVAQDFAVLARFRVDAGAAPGKPFYHYYLAGIRGLGTWGAGWYLDHYPDAVAEASEEATPGDVQMLLEVTFKDHRIVDVENVSGRSQPYFDQKNDPDYIRAQVEAFSLANG